MTKDFWVKLKGKGKREILKASTWGHSLSLKDYKQP